MRATTLRGDIGPGELSMGRWEEKVAACLAALGKNAADVAAEAKGAGWKVAVAGYGEGNHDRVESVAGAAAEHGQPVSPESVGRRLP